MAVPSGSRVEMIFQELICKKPYHSFASGTWYPPTDVYETESDLVVKMAISGVPKEDISITLTGNTLTISGRRQDHSNHQKVCYYLMEIRYGYFERNIELPRNINADKIEASCKDGFLLVTIPKKEEEPTEARTVKIPLGG